MMRYGLVSALGLVTWIGCSFVLHAQNEERSEPRPDGDHAKAEISGATSGGLKSYEPRAMCEVRMPILQIGYLIRIFFTIKRPTIWSVGGPLIVKPTCQSL